MTSTQQFNEKTITASQAYPIFQYHAQSNNCWNIAVIICFAVSPQPTFLQCYSSVVAFRKRNCNTNQGHCSHHLLRSNMLQRCSSIQEKRKNFNTNQDPNRQICSARVKTDMAQGHEIMQGHKHQLKVECKLTGLQISKVGKIMLYNQTLLARMLIHKTKWLMD